MSQLGNSNGNTEQTYFHVRRPYQLPARHDNARHGAELYNSHFAESKKIEDFDEYMFSLRPGTNTRNPWFRDYWHKLTGCGDLRAGERFCDQVDSKL